jgi:hypothetical protein
LHDDADLHERLGASATSSRSFPPGDSLNAYLEVYSNNAAVTLDDLMISGVLRNADGKEAARGDSRVQAERVGTGRWRCTIEFQLADVPPGRYLLAVDVSSSGRKEPVRRAIPLTIKPDR